jgi:hypothetical protein
MELNVEQSSKRMEEDNQVAQQKFEGNRVGKKLENMLQRQEVGAIDAWIKTSSREYAHGKKM